VSYNSNIPQGTDPTLQSQKQLLSNFQTIASLFAANHYPLIGNQDYQGMHVVMTMQPQNGDPSTDATQVALYNKLVGGIPALFFAPNSDQTPIQLTYPFINTTPTNAQQYSFVAGPFVIYGGLITNPPNGFQVTLSPTTNILYAGTTTANYKLGSLIQSPTTIPTSINSPLSTFTISYDTTGGTTTRDVYYFAIGQ
jgi:hypothetical protein